MISAFAEGMARTSGQLLEKYYRRHTLPQRWLRKVNAYVPGTSLRAVVAVLTGRVMGFEVPVELLLRQGLVFMHSARGTVIHPSVRIEAPAVVFHDVTMGESWGRRPGVPTVDSFVVIGSGARLLGPVAIGPCSIVGANAVVSSDVPPLHIAEGVPAKLRPLDPAYLAGRFFIGVEDVLRIAYEREATSTPVERLSREDQAH